MPKPVVVIVDPYSSGGMLAPAMNEAGLTSVAVTSEFELPEVLASSYRPADFDVIIHHTGDAAQTLLKLRRLNPVVVVAGAESGVELADYLAARLTPLLANVPELLSARRHKGDMINAVASEGLSVPRSLSTASPDQVAGWLERESLTGCDLVIKPVKSMGTDGVTLLSAGVGWREHFDRLLGSLNRLGQTNDELIVQEYLVGTEYVVDAFSHDGIHTVADFCRYRKVRNGPHMAIYDSMEFLPYLGIEQRVVIDYSKAVLDALGIRFGATHTEVMLTSGGPRLIEMGARLAGGGQPELCRLATGSSAVDRMVWALSGEKPIPLGFALHQTVMAVFLIARSSGILRNAEQYERIRELATFAYMHVAASNGDYIPVTCDLWQSYALGSVILAHKQPERVYADYQAIRELEQTIILDSENSDELASAQRRHTPTRQ
jgi:biotin carboxylase